MLLPAAGRGRRELLRRLAESSPDAARDRLRGRVDGVGEGLGGERDRQRQVDLLMTRSSPGYLRDIITGEHYRFVSMWMTKSTYLTAMFVMLIFVSVSVHLASRI